MRALPDTGSLQALVTVVELEKVALRPSGAGFEQPKVGSSMVPPLAARSKKTGCFGTDWVRLWG